MGTSWNSHGVRMSFRVYQIQNSAGQSIGKKQYYKRMSVAKNAAYNCASRLDKGSKIVELEVSETPLSEVEILWEDKTSSWNPNYSRRSVTGFATSNKDEEKNQPNSNLISFN